MNSGILSDDLNLTPSHFETAIRRARKEFEEIGITDGDTVALLLRNDIAFLVAMTALGRSGVYAATLNWQSHADEVAYVLKDCNAGAILVDDETIARFIGVIPSTVTVYVVGSNSGSPTSTRMDRGRKLLDWNKRVSEQSAIETDARAAKGVIVYTSGTTGKPKGVRRQPYPDKEAEARHATLLGKVFGVGPNVRTIISAPLYHSGPSAYARLAVRNLGTEGLIVLHRKFEPEKFLADIQKYSISHLWMVPTMFHRLLSLPEKVRNSFDTSSLRWVIHSAAHCPIATKEAMIRWWGPVIYEFYGATETGPATLATPQAALLRPGTVGRVLPGITLSIRDEDGRELPAGSVGEICCINDSYPDFTYVNREDERRVLNVDGQIRTGDGGEMDEGGYLFIRDRLKDMVIVGGVNVYPAEIEAVLIGMPEISDCAVFGLPNDEYGEVLAAAVVAKNGATVTPDDISRFLAASLGKFKLPKRVFVLPELPRQDSGKILKRRLREQLAGQQSRHRSDEA